MKTVTVHLSRPYDIHIESGILARAGEYIKNTVGACRVMIVTDDTVRALYGDTLSRSLHSAGLETAEFVIPHGEASKNTASLIALLNALAENAFTRTDIVCALGGGVVGDLAGFAAAVYLRGIRYVGIPTTLLASVDSSVGGKTAVDLDAGKNLAGAFHHPSLVLCDPDTLHTLTPEVLRDGFAEVIKYAVIGDGELFSMLEDPVSLDMETVIARCVSQKARIVEEDETDHGVRKHLNFGHTAGHAIELRSKFSLMHGHGVAIGMRIATEYAIRKGICPAEILPALSRLLIQYGLPTETEYDVDDLYEAATRDKKREGGHIDVVLPTGIGGCMLHRIPVAELPDFLRGGRS